jgi:putative SOS response-associated peptidase YedK
MVDRYSLTTPATLLAERFSVEVPDHYKQRYNAAPTQLLPVITSSGSSGISWFYWGRPPHFAKNKNLSEKIINLTAETLLERPALKKMLTQNRCIILADGFYVWKKVGKKTAIPHRATEVAQKPFSFAGLWEEFEDEDESMVHAFTILTVPSNDLILPFSERMPAIFDNVQEEIWLNPQSSEIELANILKAYPSNKMGIYTVSSLINNSAKDHPSLILPAPASDQHGNLTLFD